MLQQTIANAGLYNSAINGQPLGPQLSNTAIARSEIEQQAIELTASADLIAQAVGGLTAALYQVLPPEAPTESAKSAPRPVMASPLGQALDDHNAILRSLAAQIESLRARVQL